MRQFIRPPLERRAVGEGAPSVSEAEGVIRFAAATPRPARLRYLAARESHPPHIAGEGNIHAHRASAPSIMSMVF